MERRVALDPATSGTFIVRDGRVVYASAGAAALLARPSREILGRPFPEFVVPEQQRILADRYARRVAGEAVPNEYETTVVQPDGTRRVVECQVALDGTDVLLVVRDVTAQAARRPRLAEAARLGAEIQRERTEEAVFEHVREGLWALGLSSFLMRAEEDGVRVVWGRLPPELAAVFEARFGRPLVGYLGPWTPFSRSAWSEGVAFTDDWVLHASGFIPPGFTDEARTTVAARRLSRAVAIRLDERAGARFYLVVVGEWLRAADVPAVRLFGAQVTAALDAARTITDLSRHNADLAALNRIGELVGGSAELDAFFPGAAEVVIRAAGCDALAVFGASEDGTRLEPLFDTLPREPRASGLVPPGSPVAEVIVQRTPRVFAAEEHPPETRAFFAEVGIATVAWVPLVARSKVVGVMAVGFRQARDPAACRVDLLGAMGAHFAAAIESRALLEALRRRVAELTLLNDVAASSATRDPVLLLDDAVRRVAETFGCDAGVAWLRDGERLVLVASHGLSPERAHAVLHLEVGEGLAGSAVQRLAPVLEARAGLAPGAAGPRPDPGETLVAVPLLAQTQALGAIVLARRGARPFAEGEVSLLSAIGVQLGVVVENARLLADTRRRLSDLEAVHALAQRIFGNAPGDVHALLGDGCAEACRALSARAAAVLLLDEEQRVLRGAASHGTPLAFDKIELKVSQDGLAEEALRTRAPVSTEDASRDPRSALHARGAVPPLALLVVPLTSRASIRGVLFLADDAGRRFTEPERALAMALAGELAMGVENAELYAQARRRVEELGLLHEVGRSLVATLELRDVLDAGVRNLARIVDAPEAYLVLAREDGATLEVRAVAGARAELLGKRVPLAAAAPSLAARVFTEREPVVVEDVRADPRLARDPDAHGSAYLALPLVVRDRTIGTALIVETKGPRRFTLAEVQRAAGIANQLAVAVENARLYEDLRRSYAELHHAQQQLIHQERLAALGELSAVVAHEVRNPLGVIFNSLGSLRRLVRPTGDAKMLLDIVQEEADRLNRIVGDLLDFARPSVPMLRPERLEKVVEDAVSAALASAHGVVVDTAIPRDLPAVPIDARMIRQAVLNVAMNAVQAMPRGGRLAVRGARQGDSVEVSIEDSGPGIPDEVMKRIFEPFFTTKATGTGLGLAVVKRIMDGHGGEVRVESRAGSGTCFRLRFPLSHPDAPGAEPPRPPGPGPKVA